MKITYTLSNRQRKAVHVRGDVLRIALPAPVEECDPLEFARAVLGDQAEFVGAAWEEEVVVQPHAGARPDGSITSILGAIVPTTAPGNWLVCIPAIVAEISTRRGRHAPPSQPQWPAGVRIDGRQVV